MSGFLRTITSRAAHVLRGHTQRANLSSKPAKEVIGAVVSHRTGVGLACFSLAILGPSGWILAHLRTTRRRTEVVPFSGPGCSWWIHSSCCAGQADPPRPKWTTRTLFPCSTSGPCVPSKVTLFSSHI
uniref:Uncharacterized protein n=1 Tax=Sphaeramia orbicularis TaxID=375764 RepID=A0A673AZT9_9TELE